ncbi:MAG: uroporphyrinogen decarboxylase family protein [Ignavibacteriaceae bacterium]|nr:uroporphyrinogen decarboxylase family protein [Ignavibacteriaceae bacterium]
MNSRERVFSAFERKGYDRIPVKHEGTPEINQMIMDHFGLLNMEQLLIVVGDDFRYIEPIYIGPELRTFPDGSIEGYWGEHYIYKEFGGGKYLEASYLPFANVFSLEELDRSHFPTADWFDYSTIKVQCEQIREKGFAVCYGTAGDMDFINSIARARGTEQVLLDLITDDPVYIEIMEARFKFYYEMHERVLQAANGLIDFTHIGEDLGTQTGPVINMDIFEKHFAPKFRAYFEMVHRYGAKTMMHMCGHVREFLSRLTELGLDVYDVVQPTAPDMDISLLKKNYGEHLSFCGSVSVQTTLAFGTPKEVEEEVKRRLRLFPKGGLFLGPTHAIQVGSPIENIIALYKTAGSMVGEIDDTILSIGTKEEKSKINMSKLF